MERSEEQVQPSRLRQHAEALDTQHEPPQGESEADLVGRVVAAAPDALSRSPLAHPTSAEIRADALTDLQQSFGNSYVQRMVHADGSEEAAIADIQRRADAGQPLDAQTQQEMSGYFGGGVDHVRVHTGTEAARMSDELNAEAFTVGRDVFFGEGRYNPASAEGRSLLAHELTHVGQQVGFSPEVQRQPDDEEEAKRRAAATAPTGRRPEEEETA